MRYLLIYRVPGIWSRIAGRTVLGIIVIFLGVSFASFDSYDVPADSRIDPMSTAVIFTGSFERVDAGLRLISANRVRRMFISGANARAGVLPVTFVAQFSARNPDIPNVEGLVACCIEWGEKADNTLENAREAKCWLDRRRLAGPLLLITSRGHMARSVAALSGELGGRVLIPYPVEDRLPWTAFSRARVMEYCKLLGTIVAVRLSGIGGAQRLYGPFAHGCLSLALHTPPLNQLGSQPGL